MAKLAKNTRRIGKDTHKRSSFARTLPLVILLAALVACGYILFRDTTPPTLAIGPEQTVVTPGIEFSVTATDTQSGLASLVLEVVQNEKVVERFEKTFAERTPTHGEALFLTAEKYKDGPITIRARATDSSLYPFGDGTEASAEYVLDATRPKLSIVPSQLNLNQGGSGILAYTVDEPVKRSGVMVGTNFFPGYQQGDDSWLCLFAMPHDVPPAEFQPKLIAVDQAGNEGTAEITYHANGRWFKSDRINLPMSFLNRKASLFEREFPGDPETDPLGRYLKINNKLRKENRARLKEIGLETSPSPLFKGAFFRHPGTTTAGFAENRDYYFDGVPVDNQTHLGIDIASIKHAPVKSAEAGVVVFAGFYGIYGNCVVVEHGLGLQTLYSHLSEISVRKGQEVARKDVLGKTGTTGLAGGDHLHFGVLISGVPVQPKEWWDPAWVKNNITSKLQ